MAARGRRSKRLPLSDAHARLGDELRRVRTQSSVSTRRIPGFTSGHVSNVENGCVTPSDVFIDTYVKLFGEATTIRALHEQMRLAAARKRQERLSRSRPVGRMAGLPPQSIDQARTREDVVKHYLVEGHDAACVFGPTGAIEEFRSVVWIRARSPGVRLYYAGHFYDADPRRGVLEPQAVTGVRLAATHEDETGALKSYFLLDRPVEPDETEPYVVSYLVRVKSAKRALPQLAFYSLPGTQRMTLRAQFSEPLYPQKIWWFAAPNVINVEHQPPNELQPIEQGVYYREFDRLVPGWCYGFSWVW